MLTCSLQLQKAAPQACISSIIAETELFYFSEGSDVGGCSHALPPYFQITAPLGLPCSFPSLGKTHATFVASAGLLLWVGSNKCDADNSLCIS